MSQIDQLNETAIRARVLSQAFPDHAKRYRQAAESIDKVNLSLRKHPAEEAIIEHARHQLKRYHRLCLEDHDSLDELVRLCERELPELMSELQCVDKPGLRFDDTNVDWDALTAELRRIDKAARATREGPDEFGILTEPLTLEQLGRTGVFSDRIKRFARMNKTKNSSFLLFPFQVAP